MAFEVATFFFLRLPTVSLYKPSARRRLGLDVGGLVLQHLGGVLYHRLAVARATAYS